MILLTTISTRIEAAPRSLVYDYSHHTWKPHGPSTKPPEVFAPKGEGVKSSQSVTSGEMTITEEKERRLGASTDVRSRQEHVFFVDLNTAAATPKDVTSYLPRQKDQRPECEQSWPEILRTTRFPCSELSGWTLVSWKLM